MSKSTIYQYTPKFSTFITTVAYAHTTVEKNVNTSKIEWNIILSGFLEMGERPTFV